MSDDAMEGSGDDDDDEAYDPDLPTPEDEHDGQWRIMNMGTWKTVCVRCTGTLFSNDIFASPRGNPCARLCGEGETYPFTPYVDGPHYVCKKEKGCLAKQMKLAQQAGVPPLKKRRLSAAKKAVGQEPPDTLAAMSERALARQAAYQAEEAAAAEAAEAAAEARPRIGVPSRRISRRPVAHVPAHEQPSSKAAVGS